MPGVPTESWTDTYSGTSVPTGLTHPVISYNIYGNAGTTVTEANGYLTFTTSTTVGYTTVEARAPWDVTNRAVTQQLVYGTPAVIASATHEITPVALFNYADTTYEVWFLITGGIIYAWRKVAGTATSLANVNYLTAGSPQWFRIRQAAGTTYWEYSKDGRAWTILFSQTDVFDMSNVLFNAVVGNYTTGLAGTVQMDNLNLPPRVDTFKRVGRPHPFQPGVAR